MYYRPRLIPCLSIRNRDLVKTLRFSNPKYLGDPVNAVKILNGKYVDELCVLDITASKEKKGPDFEFLKDLASEAFMPLSYGGGITDIEQIKKIFYVGYEKVIINTAFYRNPKLITKAADQAGSQSIVVSLDVKVDLFGRYYCYQCDGMIKVNEDPVNMAKRAENLGAGEILLNSINRDGTMSGYDIKLIRQVADSVKIPVIACGGAGKLQDFKDALYEGNAHAAAAGSFYVFYGSERAVLITAPEEKDLVAAGIYLLKNSK